ncbi:MAG TPA: hypothetical protein DDW76_05440 [Cyanobacteria bacterium UBA11369]|nr:hypothetical protein [Cyanobacteria bacterium UBA11371]HBE48250.1 hypothetical protein [Cyanobacteria bacterium UBA11369]
MKFYEQFQALVNSKIPFNLFSPLILIKHPCSSIIYTLAIKYVKSVKFLFVLSIFSFQAKLKGNTSLASNSNLGVPRLKNIFYSSTLLFGNLSLVTKNSQDCLIPITEQKSATKKSRETVNLYLLYSQLSKF